MTEVPRQEYPRPQLVREPWSSLNGPWRFAFDDKDRGRAERWFDPDVTDGTEAGPLDLTINVPFCYQAELSGIGSRDRHDVVWYARRFDDVRQTDRERLLLHFGAVDYRAQVWVNGTMVVEHEGGHTPFSADVTASLRDGSNVLVVRAEDPLDDLTIPRGKQYWRGASENIFYTPTTGIWQPVWLEPVSETHVERVRITPDLGTGSVEVDVDVAGWVSGTRLRMRITVHDVVLVDDVVTLTGPSAPRRVSVVPPPGHIGADVADWQGVAVWTPQEPTLHDLRIEVHSPAGIPVDAVDSYFGMRSVETRDGRILLNGRPCYLRLVLDQGYFPGGLLTAPTDGDLRRDIELAKELGFNGARKHQKVEDPRWLHWADRLGFLVWGEMANAYQFSADAVRRTVAEWQAVVTRDYSHPCIIAWVPMNESWGVPALPVDERQRSLLLTTYHLTHALDATRPVVSNDGWEHALTDLLTIHDYGTAEALVHRYANAERLPGTAARPHERPSGRPLYTSGHAHRGEPVLITEFGGIAVRSAEDGDAQWGYDTVRTGNELLSRYQDLIAAMSSCDSIAGFSYTQLTDVEQEANGLLTFTREPKADITAFAAATTQAPSGGSAR